MTISLRFGSGLLAACLLTSAQAAEYSPDQFLFGDWNGSRTRLHEAGVDLQITYVNELAWNTQGGDDHTGTYADQLMFDAALDAVLSDKTAVVVVQSPNYFGLLEETDRIAARVHEAGALFLQIFDPVSLALVRTPGEAGADIAVGEGQPLGGAVSFGGPLLGLFTAQERFLRKIPGRLVGMTEDADGERAFTLTLQTREQHIRRAKATSNICTNQGLMALGAMVHLAALGSKGLRRANPLSFVHMLLA